MYNYLILEPSDLLHSKGTNLFLEAFFSSLVLVLYNAYIVANEAPLVLSKCLVEMFSFQHHWFAFFYITVLIHSFIHSFNHLVV